jgi:aerobic carbon-monoxide dehydrogenase large subunit
MPNEAWGVGASLPRREDERHLHGRGEFVSDIKLPGTMEVAFLRSPLGAAVNGTWSNRLSSAWSVLLSY